MDNMKHHWFPTVIDTADGRFNPGVRYMVNEEYVETTVYEYQFYDKRDAVIVAEQIAKQKRAEYLHIIRQEAWRKGRHK